MNKNKLIIQIKLAMYEKKTGRTAEQLEKSRKSSYVFRGVVWTFISITIAYILCRIIYTMIFGNDALTIRNCDMATDNKMPYENMKKIVETENTYTFFGKKNQFAIIRKDSLKIKPSELFDFLIFITPYLCFCYNEFFFI